MSRFLKRILLIAVMLLSVGFLSGCILMYAMMPVGSTAPESAPASSPVSSPEMTDVTGSLPTATAAPLQAASDHSFTGISVNLPDDGSLILASDMFDAGTAELLRVDPATLEYKISLYKTAPGEIEDAFTGTLTGPVSGSDSAYYCKRDNFTVLCARPLVFEDRLAKTIYCFNDDFSGVEKIDISAWNMCAMVFSKTDHCLYYESYSDYGLNRYSVDSGETERIFIAGSDYDSAWLESILGNSGIAVFSGIRALDKAFVDILVDIKTGTVLCEISGQMDFYESDQGIYAVRQEENCIQIALFDPSALTFSSCCEFDIDSYYTDMYVDGSDGLLFLCSQRDGKSYLISCYDLAAKRLICQDPFDFETYSLQQDSSDREAASTPVGLSFGVQSPYSKESNGLMLAADSQGVILDVLFWDLNAAQHSALPLRNTESWDTVDCVKPGLTADTDANTAYAAAISEEFGIKVLIGKDADLIFPDYSVTPVEDDVITYRSLCILEETLRLYPDGFFEEFSDDTADGILFCLVGSINSKNSETPEDPCGFAYSDGDMEKIVISAGYLSSMRSNLVHEISHAIDYRIEDLGYYGGLPYLDEKVWADMNPDDFEYYYDYTDEGSVGYEESGSLDYTPYSDQYMNTGYADGVYFVDSYSKTYPTEDRARLMEAALSEGTLPDYIGGKHIQEKLVYYFSAIRAVWDCSEWPAVTSWEKSLDVDHPLIPAGDLLEENGNNAA